MYHDDSYEEELIDAGYYFLGPYDGKRLIIHPTMWIPPELPVRDLSGLYIWQGDHYRWKQLYQRRTEVWSIRQAVLLYWHYLIYCMPAALLVSTVEGSFRGPFYFGIGDARQLGWFVGTFHTWLPLTGIPAAFVLPFFMRWAKGRQWRWPWLGSALAGLVSMIVAAVVLQTVGVILGMRGSQIPLDLLDYPLTFAIAPMVYGFYSEEVTESQAERALEARMWRARVELWQKQRREAIAAGYGRGGPDGRG